jgi:hypothetical protein
MSIYKERNPREIKTASNIALLSLLNITFLPGITFILLMIRLKQTSKISFSYYHLLVAIKLNLFAAMALILISILMIFLGGFYSAWTWVFVITYFVLVHSIFITFAVWTLIRSWSGNKIRS